MNAIAINNSPLSHAPHRQWPTVLVALLTAFVQISSAQTNIAPDIAPDQKTFTAYAEKILVAARVRHQSEPTNTWAAWQFGRACFDRGEFATNDTERATLAVEGIDAMRRLMEREPKLAAGHFYLAMNLGQLARTKLLGALKIVGEMEREFKAARELDEHFEFAGPDRNLGQLYFQAPGWPASVGSHNKARKHLERAAELAPSYPENRLNLLDAYLKWNEKKHVRRELRAIETLWPMAKTNFTGEGWASSWADWQTQWEELKNRAERLLSKQETTHGRD